MRILIAEDDPTSRLVLERILAKWGYEVICATDGDQAWKILSQPGAPQLVILDRVMPGLSGLEVCRRVREQEQGSEHYTYIILLTALDAQEEIVAGLEAGADDYITKPYNLPELKVRVNAGQRVIGLTTRLLAAEEELRRQATTDPLTGVLNRRAMFDRLEKETVRSARSGTPFSLALLDLDHFKQINDTYGHTAGDEVLRQCVARVSRSLRRYDSLGRVGGEEFLILTPGVDAADAENLFERIRKRIAQTRIRYEGQLIKVTASIGVVTTAGEGSVDRLFALADQALYRAKEAGRNRVEVLSMTPTGNGKSRLVKMA